jgi:hypothetical protein
VPKWTTFSFSFAKSKVVPGTTRNGTVYVSAHSVGFGDIFSGILLNEKQTKVEEKTADEPRAITPEVLDKLPVGIKVVHEPKTALATLTGKSERRSKYTWWYKTTVSAIDGDVTIVEFGGFAWHDKKWVPGGSFTGKPFTGEEFAEWYKCPKAVLKKGESYADPTNWSSAPELRAGKTRWYFLGVDGKGKRVKGEAVIEEKGEIDPKKPKDD